VKKHQNTNVKQF